MKRLAAAAAVLLLAACGGPTSGTVIDKRHEEERRWQEWVTDYVWVQTPVWNGKSYTYTSRYQPVGGHYVDQGLDDDQKLLQWQSLDNDDPDTEYALYEEAAAHLRMGISSAHGALWDPPDWLLKSVEEEFAFLFDYIKRILWPLSMDRQRMFYDAMGEGVRMFNDAVGLEMEMRQSNGTVTA